MRKWRRASSRPQASVLIYFMFKVKIRRSSQSSWGKLGITEKNWTVKYDWKAWLIMWFVSLHISEPFKTTRKPRNPKCSNVRFVMVCYLRCILIKHCKSLSHERFFISISNERGQCGWPTKVLCTCTVYKYFWKCRFIIIFYPNSRP